MSGTHLEAISAANQKIILLPGIQVLRGVAAIMVFMFHLHHIGMIPLPGIFSFIATHGGLGVELFFVLSAFSLTYSNIGLFKDSGNNGILIFVVKRFFRIMPLFYFMLIIHILLVYLYFHGEISFAKLIINIFPVFNLVPSEAAGIVWASWSIGVEMVFYAIFPLIMGCILSFRSAFIFWLISLTVGICFRAVLMQDNAIPKGYDHYSFISQLGVFSAGTIGYWFYSNYQKFTSEKEGVIKILLFSILIILLPTLYLLSVEYGEFFSKIGRLDNQLWGIYFGILTSVFVIYNAGWMNNPILQFLGNRSYSIYLTHAVVIILIKNYLIDIYHYFFNLFGGYSYFFAAIVALILTILISELTYRFIEVKAIKYGKLYIKYLQSK